jgi:hypothetical protein
MRAESAVEPTRSQNITVTWRRSAVTSECGAIAGAAIGGAVSEEADGDAAAVLSRLAISRRSRRR